MANTQEAAATASEYIGYSDTSGDWQNCHYSQLSQYSMISVREGPFWDKTRGQWPYRRACNKGNEL